MKILCSAAILGSALGDTPAACADFSGGWYDNSSWYTPVVFAQDGCTGTMQGQRGGSYTVRGDTLSAPAFDGGLTATLVRNSTQAQDAMEFSNGAMWERNHTAPPPAPLAAGSLVYADADAVAARGAACLDGTRPAFYLWPGAETTKFVLFLEGGGWCFTEADCLKRSKGGLGSSAGYRLTMADAGGIMSANATQNPHFSNWTKAFLKYCDGSSMSGARVGASHASGAPLHYRGRANLDAVLDTLAQQGSGGMGAATEEVILSGGSAGGLAAILHLDHVASRMPAGARVVGLPDAGYFADLPNTAGAHVYRGLFQGADPVWNATAGGGTHAACLASTPAAQQWQCLMAQYVVAKTATPLFVMNAAIDVYQVQNTLQVGCVPKTCSAEQLAQMETYRTDFVTSALAPALANPANGAWVDSCIMHEQNVYYCSGGKPGRNAYNCQGWQEEQVNGLTPQQAFLRWYMGAGDHFTIDSASWPSNPTCSWHFS